MANDIALSLSLRFGIDISLSLCIVKYFVVQSDSASLYGAKYFIVQRSLRCRVLCDAKHSTTSTSGTYRTTSTYSTGVPQIAGTGRIIIFIVNPHTHAHEHNYSKEHLNTQTNPIKYTGPPKTRARNTRRGQKIFQGVENRANKSLANGARGGVL